MARAKRIIPDDADQPNGWENERRVSALRASAYHQIRGEAGSCPRRTALCIENQQGALGVNVRKEDDGYILSALVPGLKAEGGWGVVCIEEAEIHHSSDLSPYIEGRIWDDNDIPAL